MTKTCDFAIWFFSIFYIMVFAVCGKEAYGKGYLYEQNESFRYSVLLRNGFLVFKFKLFWVTYDMDTYVIRARDI